MTGSVDLRKLGDGRHLAEKPQRIEAPLIERGVGPRQLRGPAELALDLGDKLFDLIGGGLGLLVLDMSERGLLLLKGKPDLESAIGDEREHDHADKERNVFDEEPAAHDRRAGCRSGPAEPIRRRARGYAAFMVYVGFHPAISVSLAP